jgi:predicted nucleic acid-binding protein
VDTSVWVHHFRNGLPALRKLLLEDSVLCHPFVIGEVACGHLKNRTEIIRLLSALPHAKEVDLEEVLHFIEHHQIVGIGMGLIDVHLLASAVLTHVPLWTFDKILARAAQKLHVGYAE